MSPKALSIMRAVIAVLVIAILVVGGALIRQLLAGNSGVPRTELERAVFAAEEAVKANPSDPAARVKLASAYLEEGSPAAAIEQAQNAIRLAPKDPTGYYILGLSESKKGDSASAVKDLKTAVATTGQQAGFYQDAYVSLAHELEKAGDLKGAKSALDKAIDNGPENVLVLDERASFAERQKDWYAAALDYAWSLQYVPDYQPAKDGLSRMQSQHPSESKQAIAQIQSDAKYNAPAQ